MWSVSKRVVHLRHACTRSINSEFVRIGNISRRIQPVDEKDKSLVPLVYYEKEKFPRCFAVHLEWLMKKDLLGQDALLVGAPGPTRRRLVLAYLELTRKPYQYLQLTRDTTDSDIKQRREIRNKTAMFVNQAAVSAAIHGHTLVLDGLEKTERNVLPILNNLLENREMNLDNGQFLVSAQRYDELLKFYTEKQLEQMNFIRVNENFRVVALTLPPISDYKGHSLDPPLRSRFQLRDVGKDLFTFDEHKNFLTTNFPQVSIDFIDKIVSFASLINADDVETLKFVRFPSERLEQIVGLSSLSPSLSVDECLHRIYPFEIFYRNSNESKKTVEEIFKKLSISKRNQPKRIERIEIDGNRATVDLRINGKKSSINVVSHDRTSKKVDSNFVRTPFHDDLLADLVLSHAVGDFCLVGPKGCGKSLIVEHFASILNYPIEHFVLYKDLSARELLQQRLTNENGDTIWQNTPLVEAALHGRLLVLDGVHRLNNDTLVSLQRILQDRELFLPDGTRLLRADRYDQLESPTTNHVQRIHPAFRIVALAEPPIGSVENSNEQNWINAETLNLFFFHQMRSLNFDEERQIVFSNLSTESQQIAEIDVLLRFVHELRNSNDNQLKTVGKSLSTRNVLRIAKHLEQNPGDNQLRQLLIRQTSAPFLPRLVQDAFYEALSKASINEDQQSIRSLTIDWKQNQRTSNENVQQAAKVPFTVFYENPIHNEIIQQMHQSFQLGEHLLLIGPQGVAKNRIVDHYLQTLKMPREYIQLHRDTTVQSLTIQANIIDGKVVYEDSPLIKAIREGSVAVIDEADKAPTNVTGILKSLIESGSMFLSDGRRVFPKHVQHIDTIPSNLIIRTHPNFRMIVLANRPGFPFLGNDFFLSLGDHFSTFPIVNPPRESEIILLKNFAPNLDRKEIERLVDVFTELRQLSNDGIISYPYSLRELVSIVKHLNLFPNDSLAQVVRNVFDFDNYTNDTIERIRSILHRHGIPFQLPTRTVQLARASPFKLVSRQETWPIEPMQQIHVEQISAMDFHEKQKNHSIQQKQSLQRTDARTKLFSELNYQYRLPLDETTFIQDFGLIPKDNRLVILTANPLSLWTFRLGENQVNKFDLSSTFQTVTNRFLTPDYQLCILPNQTEHVVVGELSSQSWAFVNLNTGDQQLLRTPSSSIVFGQALTRKFNDLISQRTTSSTTRSTYNRTTGEIISYSLNQQVLTVLNLGKQAVQQIHLPLTVRNIVPFGDQWYLTDQNGSYLLQTFEQLNPKLNRIHFDLEKIGLATSSGRLNDHSMWFATLNDHLVQVKAQNNEHLVVERFLRSKILSSGDVPIQETYQRRRLQTFFSKDHSLLTSFYAKNEIDSQYLTPSDLPDSAILSYIELINLKQNLIIFIPIYRMSDANDRSTSIQQQQWQMLIRSSAGLIANQCTDGSLVTIDGRGNIHHWQLVPSQIQISLDTWNKQTAGEGTNNLEIEYINNPKTDLSGPKHGKIDPDNKPHVGGNQWAGGSGGRDTAGLGGIGGPYRLDSGHQVYQVPDDVKAAVPEHIRRAARELGEKVFKQRLKEIEMSEYEHDVYESYMKKISSEIKMLRAIIESLEAKSHDRQWLRHRTTGDWDERKLIEGIIGEKSIYKYRADVPPEPGSPQTKPKRLRLVIDLSASMYRFNGVDNRLERQSECVLMFLESLAGFEHKFVYDIVGHSGDEYAIELVHKNQPPKNNKERLKLIKTMVTHTMFCNSGDHTFAALQNAIEVLQAESNETVDERFVIVISDANFDRYGLSPKIFGKLLQSNENVQCFAMFIGSLGQQAIHLQKNLPSGKGFVCLETSQIPKVLKTIFTSDVLH